MKGYYSRIRSLSTGGPIPPSGASRCGDSTGPLFPQESHGFRFKIPCEQRDVIMIITRKKINPFSNNILAEERVMTNLP
mgnify:CR=1 FL=1